MTSEHLLAVLRGDELRDLGRDKPRKFSPLTLDGVEEARVGNCDCGLVGEGLEQLDLILGEGLCFVPNDGQDADEVALDQDGCTRHRSKARNGLSGVRVLRVIEDVRDVDGLPRKEHSAHERARLGAVRVLTFVLNDLRCISVSDDRCESLFPGQIQRAVLGCTQADRGRDCGIEDRIEAIGLGDRAQDAGDGSLLFELPLDGVDQPGVRNRDRSLIGERLDQLDVLVAVGARFVPDDVDHSDQLILDEDGNAEHRSIDVGDPLPPRSTRGPRERQECGRLRA